MRAPAVVAKWSETESSSIETEMLSITGAFGRSLEICGSSCSRTVPLALLSPGVESVPKMWASVR